MPPAMQLQASQVSPYGFEMLTATVCRIELHDLLLAADVNRRRAGGVPERHLRLASLAEFTLCPGSANPGEKLIESCKLGGACQLRMEDRIGSIETGKPAVFVPRGSTTR
jgi:hypothetical protein